MFCSQVSGYANELIGFIHFLYKPTLLIFSSLAIPKVVYAVFRGIM